MSTTWRRPRTSSCPAPTCPTRSYPFRWCRCGLTSCGAAAVSWCTTAASSPRPSTVRTSAGSAPERSPRGRSPATPGRHRATRWRGSPRWLGLGSDGSSTARSRRRSVPIPPTARRRYGCTRHDAHAASGFRSTSGALPSPTDRIAPQVRGKDSRNEDQGVGGRLEGAEATPKIHKSLRRCYSTSTVMSTASAPGAVAPAGPA